MRNKTIIITILLLLSSMVLGAVRGKKVMYAGGTITIVPEKTKGYFNLNNSDVLIFESKKGDIEIPYTGIRNVEYGQKAGRRVGAALVVTPFLLFSKKRKHYITIGFKDEKGDPQGVVIEVPKGKAKTIITILEVRSGKKCEYESKEAKEHVFG